MRSEKPRLQAPQRSTDRLEPRELRDHLEGLSRTQVSQAYRRSRTLRFAPIPSRRVSCRRSTRRASQVNRPPLVEAALTRKPWLLCGVSRAHWYRMWGAGLVPRPVLVPGHSRNHWRVEDLRCWPAGLAEAPTALPRARNAG